MNAVSPGTILTDMTAPLGKETLDALAEETPLERLGTPEDVAQAVCFLASPRAAAIREGFSRRQPSEELCRRWEK